MSKRYQLPIPTTHTTHGILRPSRPATQSTAGTRQHFIAGLLRLIRHQVLAKHCVVFSRKFGNGFAKNASSIGHLLGDLRVDIEKGREHRGQDRYRTH